jgi:bacterial/archaeal transporter family protein
MHWVAASLLSAFFLGVYDLFKKHAVQGNAVLPVIFFSTVASAAVWLALMAAHAAWPGAFSSLLVVQPLTTARHAQILLKSAIVAASWICSYFALKQLPVSIAAPIAATGPLGIVLGGLLLFGERPSALQWAGIATTLCSFFGLSVAGRMEGVHFHRNKWVWLMMAGTALGAASALYDKFLLGRAGFTASTVQAWFSIYLVVLFLPLVIGWKRRWWPRGKFHWRWSVPMIGIGLLCADFVYFNALRDPAALISVVSSFRRGSVLIAFSGGLLFFGEKHGLRKLPAVLGILAGIVLTLLG